jgi:inorganic pyrophosphatase
MIGSNAEAFAMPDLTTLRHGLDTKKATCLAIIETPKGSRNKFSYDPETGLFKLGGLLPEGMRFSFDFGFVPSTLGEDGDPLDVLVLMDAPAHVGCQVDIRVVGVIAGKQSEPKKRNATIASWASLSIPISTRTLPPSMR